MNRELFETAFNIMLENTTDIIFIKDMELRYRAVSSAFVEMTGKKTAEEVLGHTDYEVFSDYQLARRYERDDKKVLTTGVELRRIVEPITDEDGLPRYGSTSKYIIKNKDNEMLGILGVTKDITTEYRARQRYQQELGFLFDLPKDTYAVCYIDVDDWRVIKQRRQQISDTTLQESDTVEEVCEFALSSISKHCEEALNFYSNFTEKNLKEIYESGRNRLSFEYERKLSDGSVRWVQNRINFLTDVDSGHLCVMLSAKDIHESKMEEQRIVEAATLDLMTGVLNRETAMDRIEEVLQEESDKKHILYMLDVDNFKSLNDTLGHQAGDRFLISVADELKKIVRDCDVVGRIGGDEFFVFVRNVSEGMPVEKKAEEIIEGVKAATMLYSDIPLSGSVGISIYPQHGVALDVLYNKADMALYEAKHAGKNCYRYAK